MLITAYFVQSMCLTSVTTMSQTLTIEITFVLIAFRCQQPFNLRCSNCRELTFTGLTVYLL